jgi:hypothetical protein
MRRHFISSLFFRITWKIFKLDSHYIYYKIWNIHPPKKNEVVTQKDPERAKKCFWSPNSLEPVILKFQK